MSKNNVMEGNQLDLYHVNNVDTNWVGNTLKNMLSSHHWVVMDHVERANDSNQFATTINCLAELFKTSDLFNSPAEDGQLLFECDFG